MKGLKKIATVLFALALVIAPALAFASTPLTSPPPLPGRCTVTGEVEMEKFGLPYTTVVACRWPGVDVTGDGRPEIVELTIVLKRRGGVDCARSRYIILDPTRPRAQAILNVTACDYLR